MKAYLEELRRQRDAALPMEKRAANLLGKIREARGHQTGGDATYIPVPLTLASMGGGTANYPATKPYTEKVLLPNAAVSPTIGFGMGGLQARIKVDRRPDGVPPKTIVGQGLENQRGLTSGADIGVKPKTAQAGGPPPAVMKEIARYIQAKRARGEDPSGALGVMMKDPRAVKEIGAAKGMGQVGGGALGAGAGLGIGRALGGLIPHPIGKPVGSALGALGGLAGGAYLGGKGMGQQALESRIERGDPLFKRYLVRIGRGGGPAPAPDSASSTKTSSLKGFQQMLKTHPNFQQGPYWNEVMLNKILSSKPVRESVQSGMGLEDKALGAAQAVAKNIKATGGDPAQELRRYKSIDPSSIVKTAFQEVVDKLEKEASRGSSYTKDVLSGKLGKVLKDLAKKHKPKPGSLSIPRLLGAKHDSFGTKAQRIAKAQRTKKK
jgi:hypothetical protein